MNNLVIVISPIQEISQIFQKKKIKKQLKTSWRNWYINDDPSRYPLRYYCVLLHVMIQISSIDAQANTVAVSIALKEAWLNGRSEKFIHLRSSIKSMIK